MVNHARKQPVEQAIYESGINDTVLQPAMFMQNLEQSWPHILETGRFALPYSIHQPACYVDYRDVADAAAIALTSDKLDFGTFELCAPGMLTRIDLATRMSQALGRFIEPAEIPFDPWADQAHMPPDPLREGLRTMYEDYDRFGFPGGNGLVLEPSSVARPARCSGILTNSRRSLPDHTAKQSTHPTRGELPDNGMKYSASRRTCLRLFALLRRIRVRSRLFRKYRLVFQPSP